MSIAEIILVSIFVAAVAIVFFVRLACWIDWKSIASGYERKIPFSFFRNAYLRCPEKWELCGWRVEYDGNDVGFSTYRDFRRYERFKKRLDRTLKKQNDEKKTAELMDAIMEDYKPKPPTTGTYAIKPKEHTVNPEFVPPATKPGPKHDCGSCGLYVSNMCILPGWEKSTELEYVRFEVKPARENDVACEQWRPR